MRKGTSADGDKKRAATRSELKRVAQAKKKEKIRRDNVVANRERVRTGKAQREDPNIKGPSIWIRMLESKVYFVLQEMGDGDKNIEKFQKKRFLMSLFIVFIGLAVGFFFHPYLYLSGFAAGGMFYMMQAKRVLTFYQGWKFQRQLNFSKFSRLVIPYLKAAGGATALYTVFNKILLRTEDSDDRRSLYRLMGEMGDNPADLRPFTEYAQRSSGTDMSHLFMSTIFDFQQSTFDTQVIDELGKMAGEDMMNAIDEIIAMKLKRFAMFPTKIVMSSFILVAGLGGGLAIKNFSELDFGGAISGTTSTVDAAQEGTGEPIEEDITTTDEEQNQTDIATDLDWSDVKGSVASVLAVDIDRSVKYEAVRSSADGYVLERSDQIAFEEQLRSGYDLYRTKQNDDAFLLETLFRAVAAQTFYMDDQANPTNRMLGEYATLTRLLYVDGLTFDDPQVLVSDGALQTYIQAVQEQVDAATSD